MKKRRKHKAKNKVKQTTKHKKSSVHASLNGDKYLKTRVLVFKLRKKIRTEMKDDQKELNNLVHLVRRARRFAA
ncbi:MAG: hypothetical protein AB7F43_15005 [Bacteriovoracia bacterium]